MSVLILISSVILKWTVTALTYQIIMITKRKIIIFKLDDLSLPLSPFHKFEAQNIWKMDVMQSMQIELKKREKTDNRRKNNQMSKQEQENTLNEHKKDNINGNGNKPQEEEISTFSPL